MHISFIAMNQIIEERAAKDAAYRKLLRKNHKRTLADGRSRSDEALLEQLRSLGLKIDRDWLEGMCAKFPSAEALSKVVLEGAENRIPVDREDWVWIALVCLWERWFPEQWNFEMLDDRMQGGYRVLAKKGGDVVEAVRLWQSVWQGVRRLMADFRIGSIEEFDELFAGTNSVFNWVQDFSLELQNAARFDPSWNRERLALCEVLLSLCDKPERDAPLRDGFRRDLAECHAELGDYKTLDQLYQQWLADNPRWGWGWIGWSDAYYCFAPQDRADPSRAEEILQQGLRVSAVDDRVDIIDRLAMIYEKTGRSADAETLRAESATDPDPAPEGAGHDALRGASHDDLIAEIDRAYDGKFPEAALREARRRREEITPHLINLVRKAVEVVRAGRVPAGDGHLFALYLLAEFRTVAALPAVIDAVSLPGDGPFELFGDSFTEDLTPILAVIAGDAPEAIDGLIANRSVNEYVRWAAADSYLPLVRDGRMTRGEAVSRLRAQLSDSISNRDTDIAGPLVSALMSYAPHEALDEIREAFRLGLVDKSLVDLKSVEQSIREGDAGFATALELCAPSGIEDTVEYLREWYAFQGGDDDEPGGPPSSAATLKPQFGQSALFGVPAFENVGYLDGPPATIRRAGPRVGRNDPCSCGSGKKFKKCCGRL